MAELLPLHVYLFLLKIPALQLNVKVSMWILWSIPVQILFLLLIFISSMTRQSLTSCKLKKVKTFQRSSGRSVYQVGKQICLLLLVQMLRGPSKQSQALLRLHFVRRQPVLFRSNLTKIDLGCSPYRPEMNLRRMCFSKYHQQM